MTPDREKRIKEVLSNRQHDLTIVLENVWDPHNVSAVLRSCDAVGIQDIYIISPKSKKESKIGRKSSASAGKWLSIHHFYEPEECFAILRKKYSKIYSTRLEPASASLYSLNLTQPVAFIFGNEKDGVSRETAALSDGNFTIPQVGMIKSLNISVACAVSVYEAYRQRSKAGYYGRINRNPSDQDLFSEWMKK